jgi:predicted transporter
MASQGTSNGKGIIVKQLWIIGILAALGVFGIKVGLGLGAQIYRRSMATGQKMLRLLSTLGLYLLLFVCLHFLISHFNILDYLDHGMNLVSYGMFFPVAVAAGLLFWGMTLLLQPPPEARPSSVLTDYLLILPCPVGATVILLNLALAYSFFTLSHLSTTLIVFAFFSGIIVVTLGLIYPFRHKIGVDNSFLGIAMILVGLYVLCIFIITPIYSEINAAFAMALSNNPVNQLDNFYTAVFFIIAVILGGVGFIMTYFFNKGEL